MASIGSWWVKGFGKRPSEEVTDGFYANYLREGKRPLGGKLYVTSQRLLFCPHLLDAFFGGSRAMIPLDDVEEVTIFDPDEHADSADEIVGGGTQRRLRIQRTGGETTFFVLNNLDTAATTVEAAKDAAHSNEGAASPDTES